MTDPIPVEVEPCDQALYERQRIRPLLDHLLDPMVNLSPESEPRILKLSGDLKFRLVLTNRWLMNYSHAERRVRVSSAAVEFIWAASFAYYSMYQGAVAGTPGGEGEFSKEVGEALEQFRWAIDRAFFKKDSAWPDAPPIPVTVGTGDTSAHGVASELSLVALGFLLLHELGHADLGHSGEAENQDILMMEADADAVAVETALASAPPGSSRAEKVRLGIVIAFGIVLGIELVRWKRGGRRQDPTHPLAWQRLERALARFHSEKDDPSWAFLTAVLATHMHHVGLDTSGTFEHARDAAEALMGRLSELDW